MWWAATDIPITNVDLWPHIAGYGLNVDMSCEQLNQRVIFFFSILAYLKGFWRPGGIQISSSAQGKKNNL